MLGKLMKYEFKASSRIFLLLYGVLFLLSVVNCIFIFISDGFNEQNVLFEVLQGLFLLGYVVMIIATFIITIVVIILRFYRNLLGDEGYLMFTLPVNADSHILNKLITSVLWSILSMAVIVASLFIITAKYDVIKGLTTIIEQASAEGVNVPLWIGALFLTLLIYFACLILMFYASMAIGPNLTKNRLLGSFLAYIIMYLISQAMGLILLAMLFFTDTSPNNETQYNINMPGTSVEIFNDFAFYTFLLVNILNILLTVIYYFLTRYFIKNKLNLN